MHTPFPHICQLTEYALLFTAAASSDPALQSRILALSGQLTSNADLQPFLADVVPGVGNLMVACKAEHSAQLPMLSDLLATLWPKTMASVVAGKHIEIPVSYGGAAGYELQAVAAHAGLREDEVIQRHCQTLFHVYCLGFQPGFVYLGGLDPALTMPRKTSPAVQLPAGSVAIGGNLTGIYPAATPGGWHVIGKTTVSLFDINAPVPCLLQPGDTVQFVALKT